MTSRHARVSEQDKAEALDGPNPFAPGTAEWRDREAAYADLWEEAQREKDVGWYSDNDRPLL